MKTAVDNTQTFVRSNICEFKFVGFYDACEYYKLKESELYKKTLSKEIVSVKICGKIYYPIVP